MVRSANLAACVFVMAAGCASAGSGAGTADANQDSSTNKLDGSVVVVDDAPVDSGGMASCASTDMCASAMMLGTVSGDSGNVKLTASGYRSAWYRVRVTEDNSSVGGLSLRVAAKLTSPASPMFDVFVYVNTGSDQIECATTTGTTSTAGMTKTVRAEWGEGTFSNGSEDGRYVSIEVRPLSSSGCASTAMWQLEIEGNWN
jgi:hypothetical protein